MYIWKKDQYQWKRSDKSVFTEWPNGAWKLEQPEGTVINSFTKCAGCPPEAQIVFKDGSELLKNWVPHRKEYDWIFQKDNTAPALNWKLVDPSKVQSGKAQLSKYTFYYSPEWDSFIAALKKRFPGDIFFDYLKKEFGLENAGQIPVILFDNEKSLTAYAGRELPHGGSSGGGFGGRDSIIMDHYDAEKPLTGDPVLDDYTLRMVNFRTLFHESVHNLEQMTCLTERIGKKNLKNYAADPWFDEGIA
ncbi:MAG TPA: peptidase MA family protein, partial [Leptospiraceae bacterium]|nr:peptidase MA family protein [Leptospiraceae bacterium]